MRIFEILSELSFHGSKCTKDCSGHSAGYAWALQQKGQGPCVSNSPSFNRGCEIANDQKKKGVIRRPKIRDTRGRFAARTTAPQTVATKSIKPQ